MQAHSPSSRTHAGGPAIASLVAAAGCWGLGTVASKQVVDDVAPLTLLPIQLAANWLRSVWLVPGGQGLAVGAEGLAFRLDGPRLRRITADAARAS